VDYEAILSLAEKETEVIVWDGGNNDLPFFKPDLWITVADALRPGHELIYYPGDVNFRAAQIIIINKVNSASEEAVRSIEANAARQNPGASVIRAASRVMADNPELIRDKRVLVIEDGPTLTHGGMSFGAGVVAARMYGAREIIDPRPYAVASIAEVFSKYSHIGNVLPAMGYNPEQIKDLQETVNRVDCDSVIIATPIELRHIVEINKPSTAVHYELEDMGKPTLKEKLEEFVSGLVRRGQA
jgi:predicted GTPase